MTPQAGAAKTEKKAAPETQTGRVRPIGRIVNHENQASPDHRILIPTVEVERAEKTAAAAETKTEQTRPIGQIIDRENQTSLNHNILIPSASESGKAERTESETQAIKSLPANRPFNNPAQPSLIIRSSGRQIESSPQTAIALSVPSIVGKADELLKKNKKEYLEGPDSPADRELQRYALLLSAKKESLMQSKASAQDALSPEPRPTPIKADRQNYHEASVGTIFSRHNEVLQRDKRMDIFSDRSSSESFSSIKVNIGRIEVRAAGKQSIPPPSHQKPATTSKPGLTLDDYLKRPR
ncbi:MAG: hypothetical protein PHQ34_10995 [Methanothrix sp.]|nr:hypothetical protein [Methanothrix sp.]